MPQPKRMNLQEFQNQGAAKEEQQVAPPETPSDEPRKLKLNRKGRQMELAEDKVVELAQKGWDYDAKMKEVHEARRTLESDSRAFGEYQELKSRLNNNPTLREAVMKALDNPEAVIGGNSGQGQADGDRTGSDGGAEAGNPNGTPAHDAVVRGQLEELRSELGSLKSQKEQEQLVGELNRRIDGEMEMYSYLEGNSDWSKLVRDNVLTRVRAGDATLDGVGDLVAEEADKVKGMVERDLGESVERQRDRSRLATRPPYAGGNTANESKQFTKKDLLGDQSNLMAALHEAATQFLGAEPAKRRR